jgi:hypothetical protein
VNVACLDSPWIVNANDRPPALEILLLKEKLVLSWNQFLFAEGGDDEVRIAFATHDIVVKGVGLTSLLQSITVNQVASIRQPARSDRFPAQLAARFIRAVQVRRTDAD